MDDNILTSTHINYTVVLFVTCLLKEECYKEWPENTRHSIYKTVVTSCPLACVLAHRLWEVKCCQ